MRDRNTVRLVLMDEQKRILLLKVEDRDLVYPGRPDTHDFWVTPGGGLEGNETFEEALMREAYEEVGLQLKETGICVWTEQSIVQRTDETVRFNTQFYFVQLQQHEVHFAQLTEFEQRVFRDYHWWTLEEMKMTEDILLPPGLSMLVVPLMAGEIPARPIEITRA